MSSARVSRVRLGMLAWMALALGNLAAEPLRAMRDLTETDFVYAFMTAGRMLHQGTSCFYCPEAQRAVRAQFVAAVPTGVLDLYTNPPLAAWLIQPLAVLPPRTALVAFLGLSVAAIAASMALMGWRLLPAGMPTGTRALLVIAATATLPGAQALAVVNWDGVLLLCVAAAAWAAMARRPLVAGLLLSALLVKPQTVWLVPVALLFARSRRGLAGFGLGGAVWVVSSLLLIGPAQLMGWPRNLLPAHVTEAHETIGLPGIAAAIGGGPAGFAATGLLLAVAVVLGWRHRDALSANLPLAIGLGLAASALTAPHIWPEDVLLLAVPLVLWGRGRPLAALAGAGAIDLAYLVDQTLPGGHLEALALTAVVVGMARSLVRRPGPAQPDPLAGPTDSRNSRWRRRSPVISGWKVDAR